MSWRVLLGLIACNAIWATNPLMGKILMREYSPLQVSWLRYGSAFFVLLAVIPFLQKYLTPTREVVRRGNVPWVFAMGIFTFFGSPILQYRGLALSTSTANALIVAMEPLFAVLLAWGFLKESLSRGQLPAFLLAILGFGLLSNVKPGDLVGSLTLFSVGNLMILLALPMEAIYTVVSRKLVGKVTPISLFFSALLSGLLCLTLYLSFRGEFPLRWPSLTGVGAILWLGPIGTATTYIFWTKALSHASVAAVSLTLFVQPILGAAFGALLLGEQLDGWQATGAAAILAALVWQTRLATRRKK